MYVVLKTEKKKKTFDLIECDNFSARSLEESDCMRETDYEEYEKTHRLKLHFTRKSYQFKVFSVDYTVTIIVEVFTT